MLSTRCLGGSKTSSLCEMGKDRLFARFDEVRFDAGFVINNTTYPCVVSFYSTSENHGEYVTKSAL